MDLLQHFISGQMRATFQWGWTDCVTLAADWIQTLTGADPMEDLRGRYHSLATCQRLTGFLTDPMRVVAPRMAPLCSIAQDQVQRGDVGLAQTLIGDEARHHAAIALGGGLWVLRDLSGIAVLSPRKVLAAWATGYVAARPGVAA